MKLFQIHGISTSWVKKHNYKKKKKQTKNSLNTIDVDFSK
jgi:hypothetical protein